MAIDISSINNTLNAGLQRTGSDLRTKIGAAQGKDLSDEEMMQLQFDVQNWSLMVNLQSNIMKAMSDAMKNTVSNMR
jgi:type III secretion apparatus needle protein